MPDLSAIPPALMREIAELGAPRGTMIAAEQPDGIARNSGIARAIVREMRQSISVYCNVSAPERVSVGDRVVGG